MTHNYQQHFWFFFYFFFSEQFLFCTSFTLGCSVFLFSVFWSFNFSIDFISLLFCFKFLGFYFFFSSFYLFFRYISEYYLVYLQLAWWTRAIHSDLTVQILIGRSLHFDPRSLQLILFLHLCLVDLIYFPKAESQYSVKSCFWVLRSIWEHYQMFDF
jgi:hypothetical protein